MARRPKQYRVTRGVAGSGMRSRIFFSEVGLNLYDSRSQAYAQSLPVWFLPVFLLSHQHLAQ